MTAHVSKEQLGLMLPGTMDHYFQDEQEYLAAPRPGLFARAMLGISDWFARRATITEVAHLSDAQLADIGVTRADLPSMFDGAFTVRQDQDRTIAMLQAGRVAGM